MEMFRPGARITEAMDAIKAVVDRHKLGSVNWHHATD